MNDKLSNEISRHHSLMPSDLKKPDLKPRVVGEVMQIPFGKVNYNELKGERAKKGTARSLGDALKSEQDFMEYVLSLPVESKFGKNLPDNREEKSNQNNGNSLNDSMASSSNKFNEQPDELNSAGGFEHLDNLCKLMTQLGELREANSKLQRKVDYLEEVKRNQAIDNLLYGHTNNDSGELSASSSPSQLNQLNYALESPEPASFSKPLAKSKTISAIKSPFDTQAYHSAQCGPGSAVKLTGHGAKLSEKRFSKVHKSRSTMFYNSETSFDRGRSKSVGHEQLAVELVPDDKCESDSREIKGRKLPRWSRVKNVFGWDKNDSASSNSTSPNQNASSENIYRNQQYSRADLNEDYQQEGGSDFYPEKSGNKLNRGAWSKAKNMISPRRNSVRKKKFENSLLVPSTVSTSSQLARPLNDSKQTQFGSHSTLIPLKGSKSLSDIRNKNLASYSENVDYDCHAYMVGEYDIPCEMKQNHESVRSACNQPQPGFTSNSQARKIAYKQSQHSSLDAQPNSLSLHSECGQINVQRYAKYRHRVSEFDSQPTIRVSSMSPPVQRRSKWIKMKKVFANAGEVARPIDLSTDNDEPLITSIPASPMSSETSASFAFDEDRPESKSSSGRLLPLAQSATAPVASLVQELQRNLSDDFNRKIEEWERMKAGGNDNQEGLGSRKVERKPSLSKLVAYKKKKEPGNLQTGSGAISSDKSKMKVKDINWLEKELSKIQKEKEKLDKERAKFEERAAKLAKLKETVINSDKSNKNQEILIRTSAGEFRFQGISHDFTRKLYEWETKKGVCPESSTIALLDSSNNLNAASDNNSYTTANNTSNCFNDTPRITLSRCLSRSEASILSNTTDETTPKTSTASLPSLQQKRVRRARDDPEAEDVASSRVIPKKPSRKISAPNLHEANKDSAKFSRRTRPVGVDSDVSGDAKEDDKFEDSESYYALLETNMFLLEKLKAKEEICRRLESELKSLDEKMEAMNDEHRNEMEKYRQKLWEVHRAGSQQGDMQNSYKMIDKLKERVEQLQACSDQLRKDKETLEESFRYHCEQQAKLTIELLEKMKDLQEIGPTTHNVDSSNNQEGLSPRRKSTMKLDPENVIKLHELSSELLAKAQRLEQALAERTKQICCLRWELLNREVATVKLKTELESSNFSRNIDLARAKSQREEYRQRRSWSSSEKLNILSPRNRFNLSMDKVHSWILNGEWPKINHESTDLCSAIQELRYELYKLTRLAGDDENSENVWTKDNYGQEKPVRDENVFHSSSSLMSIDRPGQADDADIGERNGCEHESIPENVSPRRDNRSSLSGPEFSESSDLNDVDETCYVLRLPRNCRKSQKLTRSSSSSLDNLYRENECFASVKLEPRFQVDEVISDGLSDEHRTGHDDLGADWDEEYKITLPNSAANRVENYCQSLSQSSSEFNDQKTDSWSDLYKRKVLFNQFSETSSSPLNEGLEESSSVSVQQFCLFDAPQSVQSSVASSSSSCRDKFASIPMINEADSPVNYSTSCLEKNESQFTAVTEVFEDERRHSDPWNRISSELPASSLDIIQTNNSSSHPEEKKKEQSLSPVIYTIRLARNRVGRDASKCHQYQSLEDPCQPDQSFTLTNDNLKPHKSDLSMLPSSDQQNSFSGCKNFFQDIEIAAQQVMDFLDAPHQFSDCQQTQQSGLQSREQCSERRVDCSQLSHWNSAPFPAAKSSSASDIPGKGTSFSVKSSGKSSIVDKMSSLIRRSSSRSNCNQRDFNTSSPLGQLCKQSLNIIHPSAVSLANNSVHKSQSSTFSFSVNDPSPANEGSREKAGQTEKLSSSFFSIFKFK